MPTIRKTIRPYARSILSTLAALLLVLFIWQYIESWLRAEELEKARIEVNDLIMLYGMQTSIEINQELSILDGLAAFAHAHHEHDEMEAEFYLYAAGLYGKDKGIRSVQFFPVGQPVILYPIAGNEATVGRTLADLMNDERQNVRADVWRAIETRQPVISGPYELRQGGMGVVARQSVFKDREFLGMVVIVLDLPPILKNAGFSSAPQDLKIAIRDVGGNVFWGDPKLFQGDPVRHSVSLPEGEWEIAGEPAGGWEQKIRPNMRKYRVFAGSIGFLVVLLTALISQQETRLKLTIEHQTHKLQEELEHNRRSHAALRESEEKFRTLAENSQDYIVRYDRQYRYIYMNPARLRVSDLREEDVIGKRYRDIGFDPVIADFWEQSIEQVFQSGQPSQTEFEWNETGSVRYINWLLSPEFGEDGQVHSVLGVSRDITAQKHMAQAIRESEERFRMLFHQAPIAYMSLDEQDCLIEVNDFWLNTLGYAREAVAGRWFGDFLTPESRERLNQLFQEASTGGELKGLELELSGADGRQMVASFDGLVVRSPEGVFRYKLLAFQDITDRKRAEERLQLQGAALEAAANAIAITDVNGVIEWVNPAFMSLTGYTAEEAVGRNPRELVKSGQHDAGFYRTIWDTILAGNVWRGEIINRRKDGTLYVEEQTITPLRNGGGKVKRFIAIKQDATERKKTQARLLESQQALMMSLQRLRVLHNLDLNIARQMELREMTRVVLEHIRELGVLTAAALFTPAGASGELALSGDAGFPYEIRPESLRLPEIYHQSPAAQPLQDVYVYALDDDLLGNAGFDPILQAAYRSCVVLPLVILDQVKGVIMFFSPHPSNLDSDWLEFLKSLAFQIAITLDRYSLFASMEQANEKLTVAYEATLEGWSRALELRERETAGHSLRVVKHTLALARAFGVSGEQLQQMRRGALLHDIGKMGVPDGILLKNGPLNEEDWKLMRQHPVFAYNLLGNIPYLENSLEIPYYHHEKWDGSGYPHGLRGREIPLAARIFAVIDVWDALLADRPYRAGWSQDRVRAYLIEQKGRHFDPEVVDRFLILLDEQADLVISANQMQCDGAGS